MTEKGLIDVTNPSELFMSRTALLEGEEGSAVSVILEGVRPIMAEIQCLVTSTPSSGNGKVNPRRASGGFPIQRLLLICAIIEKRLKISLWYRDIYLNVVGGLNIKEPAADLSVAITIISSLADLKVKPGTALIGELGLSSEIRGGKGLEMRISEAIKMGFSRIIIPNTNKEIDMKFKGKVFPCKTLKDAVHIALDIKNIDDVLRKNKRYKQKLTNNDSEENNENVNDNEYMLDSEDIE
jgi:DNA repair protein RadA/Sms